MATTKLPLADLVSSTVSHVPSDFIKPISDTPNLNVDDQVSDSSIPLIDLQGLGGPNHSDIVKEIGQACEHGGFFQVKNHGIPENVINNMLRISKEFIGLSESESLKTETTLRWRDQWKLNCYPLEDCVHKWPSNPSSFREDVAAYAKNVRGLILRLLEAISESLGLNKDYIDKALNKHNHHMAINYYRKCPKPDELTFGLDDHTDCNLLTLLLLDDVPGLQFLCDGKWVTVNPIPNTVVVGLCDQIQVLSNDRYKSAHHRVVVNSERKRISIPTFYSPSKEAVIGPAQQLIDQYHHPAVYRTFKYGEYYDKFMNGGTCCLDMFKATTAL